MHEKDHSILVLYLKIINSSILMAKNFNTKAKDATKTKNNALIKQKMVSANSKDALKMTLDGIQDHA